MERASEPRGLVDEHLSLAAGALRDAGAYEGSTSVLVGGEPGGAHWIKARPLPDNQIELRHLLGGGPQTEVVRVEWVELRFGERPYLICPDTGARCSELFFRNGRFASRLAHGLAYRSQLQGGVERAAAKAARISARLEGAGTKGPARGANRAKLVGALEAATEQLIGAGEVPSELVALIEREVERARRPRRRLRPRRGDSPMLTRSALYAGRALRVMLSTGQVHELLDKGWRESDGPHAVVAGRWANRDDYPELDLQRIKPKAGFSSGHQMIWPLDRGRDALRVVARIRPAPLKGRRLELLCEERRSGAARSQAIAVTGAGRELFLICPINGTRHRKLYYRAGLFASAQAQRLRRVR